MLPSTQFSTAVENEEFAILSQDGEKMIPEKQTNNQTGFT